MLKEEREREDKKRGREIGKEGRKSKQEERGKGLQDKRRDNKW